MAAGVKASDLTEDRQRAQSDVFGIGRTAHDRPDHSRSGLQQRLGDAPQKIPQHADEAVVPVGDAEGDEPAQHRLRDQQPDIDLDHRTDEVEEGIHRSGDLGDETCVDGSLSA